jgi:hypothetical protein
MSTWTEAHRLANLAAAQAHGCLGVDPSSFPVDVYGAIGEADVMLIWRPLPRLFGMYLDEPGSRPGVILNSELDPAVQRQTAAHELGHHVFGHGTRADVDLEALIERRSGWSDVEKAAEAFASWFLMPRRAIAAAMACMDLGRLTQPTDVYRLSLLLGTSYRTTVRHLPNLRLASQEQARSWMSIPPSRIKAALDPAAEAPASRSHDVWIVNRAMAGLTLTVRVGDRVVVESESPDDRIDVSACLVELVTAGEILPLGARASAHRGHPVPFQVGGVPRLSGGSIHVRLARACGEAWEVRFTVARGCTGIARRWVT